MRKLVFYGFVLTLSQIAVGADAPLRNAPEMLAKAQSQGSVRVILELDVPTQAEGRLSGPAAVSSQRALISSAQQGVLARNSVGVMREVKTFQTIPFVALEADQAALQALLTDPQVIGVTPDRLSAPTLAESIPFIRADDLQDLGADGTGWTVAILDTGIRSSHNDLSGKVIQEACYSTNFAAQTATSLCPNGNQSQTGSGAGVNCVASLSGCSHGTHVAGIAAGELGVANDANLMSVQVFSRFSSSDPDICGARAPCVLSYTSDQISGLERVLDVHNASNGVSIAAANMSLGGRKYSSSCDSLQPGLTLVIDTLRSAGIATVIASGNDGFNGAISSPGCISSAITVGSTANAANSLSSFSNHASMVDMLAPGSNITSAVADSNSSRESYNGTSMATPHVAGAFAVFKELNPVATVSQIESALESTGIGVSRAGVTKPRIDLMAGSQTVNFAVVDLQVAPTNVSPTTVASNQEFTFSGVVSNVGNRATTNANQLSFYRSTDSTIDTSDEELLPQVSIGILQADNPTDSDETPFSRNIDAPAEIGRHYYGACIAQDGAEFNISNNCSDAVELLVSNGAQADAFESNDDPSTATPLLDNVVQQHSIFPIGNDDYFSFTLETESDVDLEVLDIGFGGDTTMFLFQMVEGAPVQIASNSNSGSGQLSRIRANELSLGDYIVQVEETGDNQTIEAYRMRASISASSDILLMIPPIIAAAVAEPPLPPEPDPARWGVGIDTLCCGGGAMIFDVAANGVLRSASRASCLSGSSFAGYAEIASGVKQLSARVRGACTTINFNPISLPFDPIFQYLFLAVFDGAPGVNIFRGPFREGVSAEESLQMLRDDVKNLTPYKSFTLEEFEAQVNGDYEASTGRYTSAEQD